MVFQERFVVICQVLVPTLSIFLTGNDPRGSTILQLKLKAHYQLNALVEW